MTPQRTTITAGPRPVRGGLTVPSLLMIFMPLLAPLAASAAATSSTVAEGGQQTPEAPPHIPAALFTMAPAQPCARGEQVCFTAHSDQPDVASLTATKTHIVLINPDIIDTARGSRITADHAEETGADFNNSQTLLTGEVHAAMTQGQFSASTAKIQIVDSQIASIVAQGSPALFLRRGTISVAASATPGSGPATLTSETVYGHADSITYNLKTDTVQLEGNSWLTDGCNEFTSQRITYNLMSRTVEAGPAPGATSRVHGTIRNTHAGASCATAGGS